MSVIAAFVVLLSTCSISKADPWLNAKIPPKLAEGLKNVGLNTIGDWTSCRRPARAGNEDDDLLKVLSHGWSHIVFVVCVDNYIEIPCKKDCLNVNLVRRKARALREQIRTISKQYPKTAFVISLKSRLPIGGKWDFSSEITTIVYDAFEKDERIRDAYREMWRIFATELKPIDNETLAFNLMNEPEFHNYRGDRLSFWMSEATKIISDIRYIDEGRVIILEGIQKSLFSKRADGGFGKRDQKRSADLLLKPLPFSRLIYAFHHYEPQKWTHQRQEHSRPLRPEDLQNLKDDLAELVRFSSKHNVPVVLSEFGVWGLQQGKNGKVGATFSDRARYANAVYESLVPRQIGITWNAMHDDTSPYIRKSDEKRETDFERDILLFRALRLKID
jgi:hypothetical protein